MSRTPDHDEARVAHRRSLIVRKLEADDELWIVREVDAPFDRRVGTHLVFESAGVMRRLRSFPPDWHLLEDAALYALSCNIKKA